jgi:hypothetical protein
VYGAAAREVKNLAGCDNVPIVDEHCVRSGEDQVIAQLLGQHGEWLQTVQKRESGAGSRGPAQP